MMTTEEERLARRRLQCRKAYEKRRDEKRQYDVAVALSSGLPPPRLHGNHHLMRNRSQEEKEEAKKKLESARQKKYYQKNREKILEKSKRERYLKRKQAMEDAIAACLLPPRPHGNTIEMRSRSDEEKNAARLEQCRQANARCWAKSRLQRNPMKRGRSEKEEVQRLPKKGGGCVEGNTEIAYEETTPISQVVEGVLEGTTENGDVEELPICQVEEVVQDGNTENEDVGTPISHVVGVEEKGNNTGNTDVGIPISQVVEVVLEGGNTENTQGGTLLGDSSSKSRNEATQGGINNYTTATRPSQEILPAHIGTKRKAAADERSIPKLKAEYSKKPRDKSNKSAHVTATGPSVGPGLKKEEEVENEGNIAMNKTFKPESAKGGLCEEDSNPRPHSKSPPERSDKNREAAQQHPVSPTAVKEERPYKWANWRPSTPPTPPVEYWIKLYGENYV